MADNCSGLRALLQVLRALEKEDIRTVGDIWFVGTVGEEGNGDIRGSKHLCANNKLDGFVAIDSTDVGRVLYGAVGSHRWRLAVDGTGGHSFRQQPFIYAGFRRFQEFAPQNAPHSFI